MVLHSEKLAIATISLSLHLLSCLAHFRSYVFILVFLKIGYSKNHKLILLNPPLFQPTVLQHLYNSHPDMTSIPLYTLPTTHRTLTANGKRLPAMTKWYTSTFMQLPWKLQGTESAWIMFDWSMERINSGMMMILARNVWRATARYTTRIRDDTL